ncbi:MULTISPECIES: hypothetical protein [Gordonia]|jgi:predicted HicB family RNase H-like nuclease|uniref:Toxin-antitoxin system HicB family antitoxin n=1 Tax=Gordonia sihwensis NBRC 108236 TaxID=1223544 RepID=L7LN84_9ACTN|nr:hypothetical protein CXX93_19330 [Gordonia sp. YC-JH1]GAC62359.1 hypothetical protein GSI01S_33_00450 [Gordonia sihwensis NBRC 108236]
MADPRYKRTVTANFRLDPEVKNAVAQAAREEGVSMTQWLTAAIADRACRPDLMPSHTRQEVISLRDSA